MQSPPTDVSRAQEARGAGQPGGLLRAEGVSKSFGGVQALRDGRLHLEPGSVHALCGGNGAGKSTFLNILMGILQRDAGSIQVHGHEVLFKQPADALKAGISIITQELSPIPGMTVAENIFLGREPRRAGFVVDYKALRSRTERLLADLRFDIDAVCPMHRLSLAQTQLVEIAKAFSHDSQVLIMDEPTSAIGEHETDILFRAIRTATAHGRGIIYVSHRLSEIFEIADRYTVFRDGGFVESGLVADIDRRHLVRQIVGRELKHKARERNSGSGRPILEVQALGRDQEFEDVSLSVAAGEIVGIYGLMGSGRSEFLNCIYGLTKPDTGRVALNGEHLAPGQPRQSIERGISLVTEDRKATGLVSTGSVAGNASLSALPTLSSGGVVQRAAERRLVDRLLAKMQIKTASPDLRVSSLSGGNQQKVVLARCLATDPVCLLCDEPTRGIDEGTKREVYALLNEFALAGGAVVVVSSEAPEVLDVSDRIAIFKKGRLTHMVPGHSATQEELLHLAS